MQTFTRHRTKSQADGGDVCRQMAEVADEEEVVKAKTKGGQQGHAATDAAIMSGIGAGRPLPTGLRFFEPRFGLLRGF